ncbi:MAG TPA: hypothetical protein VG826_07705 [Pirellulales bacterium]|nr:hypothetical protein [Pirellulales bacterium]
MRRSRRSLSLLLGMMAASLAIVRATTQSEIETEGTGARESSPKLIARPSSPVPLARAVPKDRDRRGLVTKSQLRRGPSVRAANSLHGIARRTRRLSPRLAVGRADHRRLGHSPFGRDTDAAPYAADTRRPVSATALILVIPDAGDAAAPRIGWSGCGAYAVGCDHLGRSVPDRDEEALIGALIAPRF